MRIFFIFALSLFVCVSCQMAKNDEKDNTIDSLKNANSQLKNGYDDLLSSVNQINEGFVQIVDAENRINTITFNHDNENNANDPTADIKENLQFILNLLEDNKTKIKSLEDKLADKTLGSEELQKMVDNFKQQLEAKQNEIKDLKKQLEEKNFLIGKMGEQIDMLTIENKNVKEENLRVNNENQQVKTENQTVKDENQLIKTENQQVKDENDRVKRDNELKEQIVNNQDAQLNTAYYVFGTKSELKQHKILDNGDILTNQNFDKSYFTKIDIRNITTIPLYSKSAKVLSKHPANAYSLQKDSKGEYTVKILNPTEFWSLTKYLVIKVK